MFARRSLIAFTTGLCAWTYASPAQAHVKWFSNFDWATDPLAISELTTGTFWSMFALSIGVLLVCVLLDQKIEAVPMFQRISRWFDERSSVSLLVMRVAAFATLLVAWQEGTLIAPELVVNNLWIERLQLTVILLLLWPAMTTLAGLGLAAIWFYGASVFGFFHMLDYVNILGVAYFLTFRMADNAWLRATTLPALYFSVGFSLIWLGCEKLVYPQWGLYLLEQKPLLTLGLDKEFFLTAAAFIEIGLGFMLMICLFGRSLSIVITLTFFLTTMVFGKVEIIGHTLIHAALIVFLFEGPGHTFTPPAAFHRTLPMRLAFAGVNFAVVVFAALFAYTFAAERVHAPEMMNGPMAHDHGNFAIPADALKPTIKLEATPDTMGGWNLHFATTNFEFTPEQVGEKTSPGTGHVHLHVDGDKAARVYAPWFHLPELPPGEHTITATLHGNDHSMFTVDGKPVESAITINVE